MARPKEYEQLIKAGIFKEQSCNPNHLAQFLKNAQDLLQDAESVSSDNSKYILAYDAMFNVVQAVLEFNDVRSGDGPGHRITAIQRVATDLGITGGEFSVLTNLHKKRNQNTYKAPVPPVTKSEVTAAKQIAEKMYAKAVIYTAPAPMPTSEEGPDEETMPAPK